MKKPVRVKFEGMSKWKYCSILFSSLLLLSSCADKNDYKFNSDYVKELYDKTFPVKDIDPDQNWKTTSVVKLNVSVYEDELETYKIKVYDDIPYSEEDPANRLAMGTVENGQTLQLDFDCPIGIDTIFVSRVDRSNRRLVQMVAINDRNTVTKVSFGTPPSRSYSYSQTEGVVITKRDEPYTTSQIDEMLSTAVEVESNKSLGADYGLVSKTNVFKLTKNGSSYKFQYDGSTKSNTLIVTTKWAPSYPVMVNGGNLTIVIANGGSLSGTISITNSSNLIILKGGKIEGNNTSINITNASNGFLNYNGGSMDVKTLSISSGNGEFYNAGTININFFQASNAGTTLVNNGKCFIKSMDALNANLENGCYMEIDGDCSTTKLTVGNQAILKCKSLNLNQWGGMSLLIGKNSMVDCSGNMKINLAIQGCGATKSLVRMKNIESTFYDSRHFYKNVTVECGDSWTTRLSRLKLAFLCSSVAMIGESNVIVVQADCSGEGNTPGPGGDTDEEKSPTYTFCYEDYYPVPGDYDFNDIVMDLSYTLTKVNNMVKKVDIPIQLTAVGATYSLGAALQLINIDKGNIESAVVTNGDQTVGNLFSGQASETAMNQFAVIPLFNDAHYALSGQTVNRFMYNTAIGHENYSDFTPRKMNVTITFKSPLNNFGLDNMDLFIARPIVNGYYDGQEGKNRVEIHLREFWGNRTASGVNFEANEAIAGNRTWAIAVPDFRYPYEQVPIYRVAGTETGSSINCAYPQFQQWASDRNQAKDWYLRPNPGSTYR
jgi:LruC domain-containing protein